MASGHPLFCCVSVGGELFGALARRHFAPAHPIGNQKPAFLGTEFLAHPIGNQKHPFLVTDEENCRDLFLKIKVFGNKFVYWGHAAISAVD